MLTYRFPERPVAPETYDGCVLTELWLRLPLGSPAGGELRCQRLRGEAPIGEALHVALEPGELDTMPPALQAALQAWVVTRLAARRLLPETATPTTRPTPGAPPAPAPEPGVLRLG